MPQRIVMTVRMSPALKKKLEARQRRRQRELGLGSTTWSLNDEIVSILERRVTLDREGDDTGDVRDEAGRD